MKNLHFFSLGSVGRRYLDHAVRRTIRWAVLVSRHVPSHFFHAKPAQKFFHEKERVLGKTAVALLWWGDKRGRSRNSRQINSHGAAAQWTGTNAPISGLAAAQLLVSDFTSVLPLVPARVPAARPASSRPTLGFTFQTVFSSLHIPMDLFLQTSHKYYSL